MSSIEVRTELSQPERHIHLAPVTDATTLLNDKSLKDKRPLATNPLYVAASEEHDGVKDYYVVVGAELAGEEMLSFLKLASPYQYGSNYGVLADWKLPAQAGRENDRLRGCTCT